MSLLKTWVFILLIGSRFLDADELPHPQQEGILILPTTEVHRGDFFAMGRNVEISGTVEGDVYVFAGQVILDGVVTGDLLGVCGNMDISGHVSGNCRLLAGNVLISGDVKGNVSTLAGSVQCRPSAHLDHNFVSIAGTVNLGGTVAGDANLIASHVKVSSHIHHNLQGYMGELRLTSKAQVDGSVDYRSHSKAWIDPRALIHGEVLYHPSIVHKIVADTWMYHILIGSQVLIALMNFIYTFVVGLVCMRLFPDNFQMTLHTLDTHPWKALLYGAGILVLLPCVFLLLLITILGVPFALTLMAVNVIGFYTAKVYTIAWGSRWLFSKLGWQTQRALSYFCGVILYFVLIRIPFAGPSIAFIALLLGLGAGIIAQTRSGLFSPSSGR